MGMLVVLMSGVTVGCLVTDPSQSGFPDNTDVPDVELGPGCLESPTLTIGRCEVAGTEEDCTGVPGESPVFIPLEERDDVNMVIGSQGSTMFVLAIQTRGVDAGDPDDPTSPSRPEVRVSLSHGESVHMAFYRSKPLFVPDEDDSMVASASGLFVIVEQHRNGLAGELVQANASITDNHGEYRCGTVAFVAAVP